MAFVVEDKYWFAWMDYQEEDAWTVSDRELVPENMVEACQKMLVVHLRSPSKDKTEHQGQREHQVEPQTTLVVVLVPETEQVVPWISRYR